MDGAAAAGVAKGRPCAAAFAPVVAAEAEEPTLVAAVVVVGRGGAPTIPFG